MAVHFQLSTVALSFAGSGEDGFQFLSDAGGARGAAMGGAGSSLGGDIEGAFRNPGALVAVRAREASLSHTARPEGVSDGSLAYVHPTDAGAWGLRAHSRAYGDIPGYDGSGGPAVSYGARDTAFSLGYGRRVGRGGAGIVMKQASQSLAGRSAGVVAGDAGLFLPWTGTPMSFSLGVRNLGPKASLGAEKTSLPRSLDAGAGIRLLSGALMITLEGRSSAEGFGWGAGAEAWAYNALALRAGVDGSREAGDGLCLGMGMKVKTIRVDYAFTPLGDALGAAHRMNVSFRFGGAGERLYQRGLALSQKGAHAEAVLLFKEALDADPGHREAARALRESIRSLEIERDVR